MSEANTGGSITPEEAEQFCVFASTMFAGFPTLRDDLLSEAKRAARAMHEVTDRLAAGRAVVTTSPTASKPYDDAQSAQSLLFERNLELVIRGLTALAGMKLTKPYPAMLDKSTPAERGASIQQLRALGFDLAIAQFFSTVILIALHGSIGSYLDACEAYLGREVGSHDARRRIVPIITQIALASPGLFAPPIVSNVLAALPAALEVWKQVKANPQAEDVKIEGETAKGILRLHELAENTTNLSEQIFFAEGIVGTSAEALMELRAN